MQKIEAKRWFVSYYFLFNQNQEIWCLKPPFCLIFKLKLVEILKFSDWKIDVLKETFQLLKSLTRIRKHNQRHTFCFLFFNSRNEQEKHKKLQRKLRKLHAKTCFAFFIVSSRKIRFKINPIFLSSTFMVFFIFQLIENYCELVFLDGLTFVPKPQIWTRQKVILEFAKNDRNNKLKFVYSEREVKM